MWLMSAEAIALAKEPTWHLALRRNIVSSYLTVRGLWYVALARRPATFVVAELAK